MLVSLKPLLQNALKKKFAIPALNVNSMEMVQAVFFAAQKAKSPVIVQVSPSALAYSGDLLPAIVLSAGKKFPKTNFALHLDHGQNFEQCKKAISLGFSSVMIDASIDYSKKIFGMHPPRKFSDNARITKKAVQFAHKRGISVEAEIGTLGGIEDEPFLHGRKASGKEAFASQKISGTHLTNPEEAKAFAEATGIDALAIAIGTSHGAYKFKGRPRLAFGILKETKKLLPKVPLVLHGASSVPKPVVMQCRKLGLNIGSEAKGVPIPELRKAISLGICKINIDTDARLAFMGGVLQKARDYKGPVDLREYFSAGRIALEKLYAEKMLAFGSKGQA